MDAGLEKRLPKPEKLKVTKADQKEQQKKKKK